MDSGNFVQNDLNSDPANGVTGLNFWGITYLYNGYVYSTFGFPLMSFGGSYSFLKFISN